uniref:Proteasome assembly chaperone 2 n=1 Tax=Glossina palpalis gambiensis TaxID=67801 RepID=A0A1B0C7X1_9MUSC
MLQLKGGKKSLDLNGYTVIVPSICVGNAAQLACDLLISSKQLKKIGNIHHSTLIPIFGPCAFEHEPKEEKAAACELYENAEDKLLVLQFRAPFISKHIKDFHQKLAQLLKEAQSVIILSGNFGYEKRIIDGSSYEYKANEQFKDLYKESLSLVKWREFSGETIFGGGNALQLYRVLESLHIPVMVLFRYLLDGDNSIDATLIVAELNELCKGFLKHSEGSQDVKLVIPSSWKLLFGNDFPELIF